MCDCVDTILKVNNRSLKINWVSHVDVWIASEQKPINKLKVIAPKLELEDGHIVVQYITQFYDFFVKSLC